jgi:hypothetical protein
MSLSEEDNRAVRADGTLKDASEITWVHSPTDETPISGDKILADDPDPSEGTQEATPPPAPPQREAGKRQIKLSSKLQQQPTLEHFVIAGISLCVPCHLYCSCGIPGNRTIINSSSKTTAAGTTSNTKSVSVKKQTTRTRSTAHAAANASVSGNKRPAPKNSDVESKAQKRVKHSRTATTTSFASNECSGEDNGHQMLSNDDGDLYADDDGDLYDESKDTNTQMSEASSRDAASNAEYERITAASKIDKQVGDRSPFCTYKR